MLLHDPLPVEGHRAEGAGETLLVTVLQRLQMSLKLNVKSVNFLTKLSHSQHSFHILYTDVTLLTPLSHS